MQPSSFSGPWVLFKNTFSENLHKMTLSICFDDVITSTKSNLSSNLIYMFINQLVSKFEPQKCFKNRKNNDDVIFPRLVLGLELCRSRSRSQIRNRSRS